MRKNPDKMSEREMRNELKAAGFKKQSFFVTTELPRMAEFSELLDPDNFGAPLNFGYDPYNSYRQRKWTVLMLEDVGRRETYEVAP
jgi:hypothetical protein